MINKCAKLEVSSFIRTRNAKGAQVYQNKSFLWVKDQWVTQGHPQCHRSKERIRLSISRP